MWWGRFGGLTGVVALRLLLLGLVLANGSAERVARGRLGSLPPPSRMGLSAALPLAALLAALAPLVRGQQQETGQSFCESGAHFAQTDKVRCRASECCQWNKHERLCYSAVGDAPCGDPSASTGFSVGDEVIIGEIAADERACITAALRNR